MRPWHNIRFCVRVADMPTLKIPSLPWGLAQEKPGLRPLLLGEVPYIGQGKGRGKGRGSVLTLP